jgi:transketolase
MRNAFVKSLLSVAERDPRIFLLTADLGYSVLEPFRERFPDRYLNVGVAEQNMTGIAAGLAMSGYTVYTYSIANFPTLRCLEQIRNDVCYHQANVKIVAVGGGFAYGAQGYTHHGVEDLAVLRALPGMTVVAPADPIETAWAAQAVAEKPGPAYLRLGKGGEPILYANAPSLQLGKAAMLRDGSDVTLIGTGAMLAEVLKAADELASYGIQARVLSMHTIKPLDEPAIARAALQTGAIVTIEEHTLMGGLGSAVAETLMDNALPKVRFHRCGVPSEVYHEIGSQAFLRQMCGNLVASVRSLLKARTRRAAA